MQENESLQLLLMIIAILYYQDVPIRPETPQLIQNDAAPVLTRTTLTDDISPSLHWRPVKSRIEFKNTSPCRPTRPLGSPSLD